MDRSRSMSAAGETAGRVRPTIIPPWERQAITQVPFLDPASPQLSNEEKHALPCLWAAQANDESTRRARLHPSRNGSGSSLAFSSSSAHTANHSSRHPPQTAVHLQSHSAPYETPLYTGRGTSPPVIATTPSRLPPTPPESLSNSSTFSSTASPPASSPQTVTPFPGTMSTRAQSGSRSRSKSSRRARGTRAEAEPETNGLGKRFKSAFKDMFKRNPIDESSFEQINDRHWTDEF